MGPHQLRRELGTINEMFLGGEQQDCHELLTLLLDTLSEDLNRVKGPGDYRQVGTTITLFSLLPDMLPLSVLWARTLTYLTLLRISM